MFKHLVIPLDGSFFAEKALPYALELASKFGGKITLVQIPQDPPVVVSELGMESADFYMQMRDTFHGEAETYLKQVAADLEAKGFMVATLVREGTPVADTLIKAVHDVGADAIVMSTHGRSGLGRLVFGSVAEQMLRQCRIPVLLIRVTEEERRKRASERSSALKT